MSVDQTGLVALAEEYDRGAAAVQSIADAMIDAAVDAILECIMNSPDVQAMLRANRRFGQRVNRANRHKWRRCYLLEKQLGAPATEKELPHAE